MCRPGRGYRIFGHAWCNHATRSDLEEWSALITETSDKPQQHSLTAADHLENRIAHAHVAALSDTGGLRELCRRSVKTSSSVHPRKMYGPREVYRRLLLLRGRRSVRALITKTQTRRSKSGNISTLSCSSLEDVTIAERRPCNIDSSFTELHIIRHPF